MPPAALSWIFITEKCIQDRFSKSRNLSFDRSVPRILSPSIIQRAHCKEHLILSRMESSTIKSLFNIHLRFEVFVSTLLGLLTFNFVGRSKQPLMYRHWKKKDVSKTNSSNLIGEKLSRKICAPLNFKKRSLNGVKYWPRHDKRHMSNELRRELRNGDKSKITNSTSSYWAPLRKW